jgi:hypothetical protein
MTAPRIFVAAEMFVSSNGGSRQLWNLVKSVADERTDLLVIFGKAHDPSSPDSSSDSWC